MAIKLHERTLIVAQAKYEIATAVLKIEEKHDLTIAEMNGILLEITLDNNKYAIREERHPECAGKKGDEA